jgi:hypothetical protein
MSIIREARITDMYYQIYFETFYAVLPYYDKKRLKENKRINLL